MELFGTRIDRATRNPHVGPGISVGGAPQGRKARARSYVDAHKFGTRSEQKNMRQRDGLGPSDPALVHTVASLAHLAIDDRSTAVENVGE